MLVSFVYRILIEVAASILQMSSTLQIKGAVMSYDFSLGLDLVGIALTSVYFVSVLAKMIIPQLTRHADSRRALFFRG